MLKQAVSEAYGKEVSELARSRIGKRNATRENNEIGEENVAEIDTESLTTEDEGERKFKYVHNAANMIAKRTAFNSDPKEKKEKDKMENLLGELLDCIEARVASRGSSDMRLCIG